MTSGPITMLSWGARLLYCGPAMPLSWHANGVDEFSIALDGHLLIETEDGGSVTTNSALVPAGLRHNMTFQCERVACLYVDVSSSDGQTLRQAMRRLPNGLAVDHGQETAIIAVLNALGTGRIPRGDRRLAIARALGLDPFTVVDSRIAKILDRLHAAPQDDHRVADLAPQLGLSEERFRKAFRQATGVPLKRYRVWVRLMAAMKAARHGASLTEAAHASGFSSSAHFSLAYRKMFGMTPSDYSRLSQQPPVLPA